MFLLLLFIFLISFIFIYFLVNIYFKKIKSNKNDKVINLGLSRTGTSSICDYLSKLGYHSWHFTKNHKRAIETFGFNAIGDLPNLRRKFTMEDIEKDTKYILTTRNKNDWYKSMHKWILKIWNIDIKDKSKKQPLFNKNFKFNKFFGCNFLNPLNNYVHDIKHEYPELYDNNFMDVIENHEKYIINESKLQNLFRQCRSRQASHGRRRCRQASHGQQY